ncbi:hypothetical protein P154DRAFT_615943 [Amniculicola lignicola CBS 123094]|uniref:Rhodopsin domain-containing protein n=1 Tax=Amniculicola lignicola CBS 123094 TaxID=1392246 RepID=A0A6A5X2P1_9PLEO|nr:hypothetical protein P154DRAFT_615943 [Amniculicola lignicola CBS 123094]
MSSVDLSQPVAPPPPGVIANFSNPASQSVLAYSCIIVAFATLTFFAWFRFVVKYWIVKTVHIEDYLIPFAWLAAAADFICGFIVYDFAPIIHSWDIQLITYGRFILLLRISACFFNVSILLIKCSMLIQVIRVFVPRGTHSRTYWLLITLIVANILFHTAIAFTLILSCKPITKAWHPWEEGKCLPVGILATTSAVMNLISDLSILCVAQWVVWNVIRTDVSKKLRLSLVFFAGLAPCAFSSLCLYYTWRELHAADFVHDIAIMTLACYGELSSAMFVLFLPVLPRFFSHLKAKHTSYKSSRSSTRLDFADIGVDGKGGPSPCAFYAKGKEWGRKGSVAGEKVKSLWHISYTQRGGDDGNGEAFWRKESLEEKMASFDEMTVEAPSFDEKRLEEGVLRGKVWNIERVRCSSVYSQ